MILQILKKKDFKFFQGKSFDEVNGQRCNLKLVDNNLVFSIDENPVACLISGECFVNSFKNKLIVFKKHEKSEAEIIFELMGDQIYTKDIKKWIQKRNHTVIFKSPLV